MLPFAYVYIKQSETERLLVLKYVCVCVCVCLSLSLSLSLCVLFLFFVSVFLSFVGSETLIKINIIGFALHLTKVFFSLSPGYSGFAIHILGLVDIQKNAL